MSFVVQSAARFFPLFFPLLAASTFVCFAKVGAPRPYELVFHLPQRSSDMVPTIPHTRHQN